MSRAAFELVEPLFVSLTNCEAHGFTRTAWKRTCRKARAAGFEVLTLGRDPAMRPAALRPFLATLEAKPRTPPRRAPAAASVTQAPANDAVDEAPKSAPVRAKPRGVAERLRFRKVASS